MTITKHPWQTGSTELIQHAITHLHNQSDFDKRVAYLLFDVGVETLFKTYLTLPAEFADTQMKFFERQQAAEGNFHDLVNGVKKAAGEKIKNIDLSHVQFYHDLRNKLYHEGNGITIPLEKVYTYAEIATTLLKTLLDVDLTNDLQKPAIEARERAIILEFQDKAKKAQNLLRNEIHQLESDLILVLEKVAPKLALPSFYKQFFDITKKYMVEYIASVDDNGNAIYSDQLTDNAELIAQYHREVCKFLTLRIDDPKQREVLFEISTLSSRMDIKIEKVLFSIALEEYPDARSVQYRVIELLIPESNNWLPILMEYNYIYSLDSPYILDDEWQVVINENNNLLNKTQKTREKIKKWLENH